MRNRRIGRRLAAAVLQVAAAAAIVSAPAGAYVSPFDVDLSGPVYALEASPDGSRLFDAAGNESDRSNRMTVANSL